MGASGFIDRQLRGDRSLCASRQYWRPQHSDFESSEFHTARGTILGWEAANIEEAVAWLRDRSVMLGKYPFVQDRERGIWTTPTGDKVAWFKDPDGNILSVSQHDS